MRISYLTVLSVIFLAYSLTGQSPAETSGGANMEIKSSAFSEGGMIPYQYTCDGKDISPPLAWQGVPDGAHSLALICDDPDAPVGTWVHWVYYDIPADKTGLSENVNTRENPPDGGTQGRNNFRKTGYGGPCPPGGTHRYFFKLYALDTILNLPPGATKKELLQKMEGHVISKAQLMGKYKR